MKAATILVLLLLSACASAVEKSALPLPQGAKVTEVTIEYYALGPSGSRIATDRQTMVRVGEQNGIVTWRVSREGMASETMTTRNGRLVSKGAERFFPSEPIPPKDLRSGSISKEKYRRKTQGGAFVRGLSRGEVVGFQHSVVAGYGPLALVAAYIATKETGHGWTHETEYFCVFSQDLGIVVGCRYGAEEFEVVGLKFDR